MLNIKNIIPLLHLHLRPSPAASSLCPHKASIVFLFSSSIQTKISKKIVLSKKKNKQLMELKKVLAKKQPIKSEQLYEQYHYKDVYKRINIQMESFFYQRPYTLENFNFLLNLISEQNPSDFKERIDQVIHKMGLLNIKPDEKSYNYIIKAAAKARQVKLAEQYFKQACNRFLPNKYLYTSLMQSYVINNDPRMALKILDEMTEKGLQPDLPTYTTLINSFLKGRMLQKCWEVNKKMRQSKVEPDETFTGVMLKVYAATHDAEKAIKLYRQNITEKGIKPMIETTNAYFKALSSRREYSNLVVDKFFELAQFGQIFTTETANWALRACATIANLRSAAEILKIMKVKNITIDKSTLSILLKVYSTACLVPNQDQKLRQIIITDSWKLLQQIQKMGGINTNVLNNILSIYANSVKHEQVDGLILPLYQKFKQPFNMYTFQILIEMYYKSKDFHTAMRVWNQMKNQIRQNQVAITEKYDENVYDMEVKINKLNQDIRPTFTALHAYLDIGIKMMDMKQVVEALEMFKKYKRMPKNQTLKFLGNLKNLPEEIQAALMEFKIQFGKAKVSKQPLPNIEDPQNI